ncbi:hypothetical protein [Histidinibacterium lentulum]|uniref:Flagellar biosynthesis protein FlgN n=1 Tax=Histidinibacterium lentulum TaxID=2480588 RepID=A0A3N2R757_9RHOB|nr:hypothetical protein [Histidinibacterium lentulum]ROU03257.1 hypothetical protein EAT49_08195 [Histidinibacterium lentulum]
MTDAIAALERLLVEERRALLAGDLGAVAALTACKRAALERLRVAEVPKEALDQIREEAQRVHALLAASLDGIATARARLRDVRQVRSRLTTYDSRGHKADVAADTRHVFERKA